MATAAEEAAGSSGLRIIGTGSALPERVLGNADLERMVETSDDWITTRTGIKTRRIAGPGEETSQLAAAAARRALEQAGVAAAELDLIVVGTITPEMTMPSCACLVQQELGANRAFAFDLNAACSGFLYGLDLADKYIRCDPGKKILVIGAETLSSRVDWQDRNTCVLFGDGAGACVVTGSSAKDGRGYQAARLFADGSLWELLYLEAAPKHNRQLRPNRVEMPCIMMQGREVFRHAVRAMGEAVAQVLAAAGCTAAQLKLVIPHQANIRIIRSLGDHLGLAPEKVYVNVDKYGNTSAATIPIALDEANRAGLLAPGDLVLLCAFGGGFTWGASLLRW